MGGRVRKDERSGEKRENIAPSLKKKKNLKNVTSFFLPNKGLKGRPLKGVNISFVILGISGEWLLVVRILFLVGRHSSQRRIWAATSLLLRPVWPSEQRPGRPLGRWWPWPHLQAVHLDMNNTLIAGHGRPSSESPHSCTLHTETAHRGKNGFPVSLERWVRVY